MGERSVKPAWVKTPLSVNQSALPLVQELLNRSEKLKIRAQTIAGTTVIDCGVEVPGSWDAGLWLASASMGGLGRIRIQGSLLDHMPWPAVEVRTDHPVLACMAAQYAGWFIQKGSYTAMGSGPGRAILASEELFASLGYRDEAATAIFILEAAHLPTEETVITIQEKCARPPEDIFLLVAPTASPAGTLQIVARSVETGLHKLSECGYDLSHIEAGWGTCPLPPLAKHDGQAMGRTNDAILYGATVHYTVDDEDEVLTALIPKIPSSASRDYGQTFAQLFKQYGNFYDMDPLLFSPAQVFMHNRRSGRTFQAGKLRPDLLRETFALQTQG